MTSILKWENDLHVNFQNCLKENDLQGPREVFTNMFPEQAKFFCATPYMSKTISI